MDWQLAYRQRGKLGAGVAIAVSKLVDVAADGEAVVVAAAVSKLVDVVAATIFAIDVELIAEGSPDRTVPGWTIEHSGQNLFR